MTIISATGENYIVENYTVGFRNIKFTINATKIRINEMFNNFQKGFIVVINVLKEYDLSQSILLLITPIVMSFLNFKVHTLLEKESDNIIICLIWNSIYDYFIFFIQSSIMYKQSIKMFNKLLERINLAKIKYGTPIPGINQKQHKDLCSDCSKLRDFLLIILFFGQV